MSKSSSFITKLRDRREVAKGTMAFQFERPSELAFKAGQYLNLILIDPPETDAEGNERSFSIVSAPHEQHLMIATRMRNTAFKRVLKTAPIETQVKIEAPFGNLTLHDDPTRPAVLLSGGIGITPFRSIVVDAANQKLDHRIFLFYSNRHPEDAPFLEELKSLEDQNPNYKFIPTMTEAERSWQGETGHINDQMISKYLETAGNARAIYYIAGPPAMVTGLNEMLNKARIDKDDIRTEEFDGY